MSKVKKYILITCFILALLVSYANKTISAVEFEKGEPSQIRELILKQKQEKKRLLIEKYKKKQESRKTKLAQQEKPKTLQKQPASFTKLKTFLIIGLLLLTIVGITLGFIINYRRQSK
ncbi:MAG: hypothetical protein AB1567_01560 [bacterium]